LEAHRKANETIHARTVVRRRPGANSSKTVTPLGTATSGFRTVRISSALSVRPSAFSSTLRFRHATFAQQIANGFGHVPSREEKEHGRNNPDDEKGTPSQSWNDQQADQSSNDQANRERRQDVSCQRTANAAGAEFGRERGGHRHLTAETEVGEKPEYDQRADVPCRRHQPGEQGKNAHGRLEGRSSADVVRECAPEQRAKERPD
jgi:hypothetical protein